MAVPEGAALKGGGKEGFVTFALGACGSLKTEVNWACSRSAIFCGSVVISSSPSNSMLILDRIFVRDFA